MVSGRAWQPSVVAVFSPRDARRAASACRPRLIPAAPSPHADAGTPRAPVPSIDATKASGLVTLKTRADFLRVAGRRQRVARPGFVLQAAPAPQDIADKAVRVGFTASRKVGNAVIRNRAKRRLRAAAAEVLRSAARPGTDYVLIARADATVSQPYADLVHDLTSAVRQIERRGNRSAARPQHGEREEA